MASFAWKDIPDHLKILLVTTGVFDSAVVINFCLNFTLFVGVNE